MTRKGDLTSRLRKLETALERAKKLARGTVLDAQPMAQLLGFSWVTLREWVDDHPQLEQPKLMVRGGQGVNWEFKPVAFTTALIKIFKAEAEQRREHNRSFQRKAGLKLPEAESAASFEEAKGLVQLTLTVVAATERQGGYTETEKVTAFLEGYNQQVVNGILGVKTQVDPNGNLPPHLREAVDGYLRSVATGVHELASKFIEEHRAGLQQAGTG